MSDESPISPQHHGTFIAVSFVLALLALAFALFTFRQVQDLAGGVAALEMRDIKGDAKADTKATEAIAALEKKVDALAAAQAAPPPPPPAPETPATPAAPPK